MADEELGASKSKYLPDALRYLDFLPGAHHFINIQKKRFYKLLVKKGLVYLYDHGFDLDPDSPILRNDEKEENESTTSADAGQLCVLYKLQPWYIAIYTVLSLHGL